MSFLYPYFLWALLAIAIPIIIHLFNFRKYTTIVFSSIRFLKEVKEETQKQSQLKHLLILISRILAIVFLVFAFAQPFIPAKHKKSNNPIIGIYVDNSFSMNAIGTNGELLQEAKKQAIQIVKTHGASANYKLVTNSFEGKHQRVVNQEQMLEFINQIETTGNSKTLTEITNRLNNVNSEFSTFSKINYLISDFQYTKPDLKNIATDSTKNYVVMLLKATANSNIYIDSCWFETPVHKINTSEILKFRIKNLSNQDVEQLPVKLLINNKQKALSNVTINSGGVAIQEFAFTINKGGWQAGEIKIDDSPITFDNSLYFSFKTDSIAKILAINEANENPYLKKLYSTDLFFEFTNTAVSRLNYANLKNYETIIINELTIISSGLVSEILKYTGEGGNLIIIPNKKIDNPSYKELLLALNCNYFTTLDTSNTTVKGINTQHKVYANTFDKIPNNIELPQVFSHYKLDNGFYKGYEELLPLKSKSSLLNSYQYKKGNVYLFTCPLNTDYTNLVKHGIFVPTFLNIPLFKSNAVPLYYTIGINSLIDVPFSKSNLPYKLTNQVTEIIPEAVSNKIFVTNLEDAGNYKLNQGEILISSISLNYSRNESNTSFLTEQNINDVQPNFTLFKNNEAIKNQIETLSKGISFWKLCIALCLLFLVIEILLIRYFNR